MYEYLLPLVIPLLTCSVVVAPPTSDEAQARITKYENTNDGTGNYEFSYETSNGLTRYEIGQLVNAGEPNAHIIVRGEYSYIDPDGKTQFVRYTADENGYRISLEEPAKLTTPAPAIVGFALPSAAIATLLG